MSKSQAQNVQSISQVHILLAVLRFLAVHLSTCFARVIPSFTSIWKRILQELPVLLNLWLSQKMSQSRNNLASHVPHLQHLFFCNLSMHLPQVLPEGKALTWSGLAFHFIEHHGPPRNIVSPFVSHLSSTFCIQLFPRDRNVVQTPTVSRAELLPQPAPREMPTEQRASVAETCVVHTAIPGTWDI